MVNQVHSSSSIISTLLLGINGEGSRKFFELTPSASLDYNLKNGLGLEEQNHLGLSYLVLPSSEDSAAPTLTEGKNSNLNLEATDLMLGPPGCRSPHRGLELHQLTSETLSEKPLFPLHPSKDGVRSSSIDSLLSENERDPLHPSKDGVHSSSIKSIVSGNEEGPLHPSKDGVHSSSTKTTISENKRGFSGTICEFSAQKNSGLLHPSKDGVHSSSSKTTVSGSERGLSDTIGEALVQKNSGLLHPSRDGVHSSPTKTTVSGNKRGFSDTIGEFSAQKNSGLGGKSGMFKAGSYTLETSPFTGQRQISVKSVVKVGLPRSSKEQCTAGNGTSDNSAMEPAAKVRGVGWPPVRERRKTTLTGTSKTSNKVDGRKSPRDLFVKVSMDGAPYLRKVDLRSYSTYQELSSSLREMFSCFTLGTCGVQEGPGEDILIESTLKDQIQGSEYVLSYEDKDGDWMLVGDVPWEMFTESCKKLKIMKGSDAIGLAPCAMEKSNKKN